MILAAVIWLSYIFVVSLKNAEPEVVASVIGFIGLSLTAIATYYTTKKLEINSRHFVEKKNAYMQFIILMYAYLKSNRIGKPLSDNDVTNRMLKFQQELMVWGDSEVIKAMENFTNLSNKDQSLESNFKAVDALLRSIRKDLGHNDKNLKHGSLVAMMVKSEDQEQVYSIFK